jgi:hypothetical protein
MKLKHQVPPEKKSPDCEEFTAELYKTVKEEIIPTCLQIFQEIERERILPNPFYEDNNTLIPKPDKDTTKKSYSPILSLNVDAIILNKILTNQIQQQIGKIYTVVKSISSQGCRDGSTYANY